MLGIKSLTSLAIAAFIICTGTLIGVLAVLNGRNATDDAVKTGNVGVDDCIAGAVSNVEEVTRRLLASTLDQVESEFKSFLEIPKSVSEELIHQLSAQHPDIVTSPTFLNKTVRPQLAAKVYTMADRGVRQIGLFPYPFSPNSIEGQWGGTVGIITADETMGKLPENGHVLMVLETSNDTTGAFQDNEVLVDFGTANKRGELIGRDDPCSAYVDFTKNETSGLCRFPWSLVRNDVWIEMHSRALNNAALDSGILEEANTVHYTPMSASGSFLAVYAYATWTHPEMINRYPRQNNRVGILQVSLLATDLTTMMKRQVLIEGSFLYCVDRSPWTGEIGILVGVSSGEPFTRVSLNSTFTTGTFQQASTVHVVNHTVPQIALHGKHVLGLDNRYDEAIIQSQTLNPWTFNNPESDESIIYFTQVTALEQGSLKWYLSLLVPRDRVMQTINSTTSVIRTDFQSAKSDSDDKQRTNFVVMMITVVVVSVVLLVLAVAFTARIFAPLEILVQDMEAVAFLRLDEVDFNAPFSVLFEIENMQKSFRLMTQNLKEYRNYMPQSVLVMSEDDEIETETSGVSLPRVDSLLSPARTSFTRTLSPTRSSFTRTDASTVLTYRCDPLEEVTKRKTISILVCNIRNWHGMISRLNDSELLSMHSDVLSIVFQAIASNKGICDNFSGDHLQGMFNTIKPSSTHRTNCLDAGVLAAEKLPPNTILSFSAGSGDARCGNAGCAGLKRYTAFTTCIPWICDLERYNLQLGTRGLVDKFCHAEARQRYDLRCLDLIEYKKRSSEHIRIYEFVKKLETRNEEWMYALDNQQANSWNTTMEAIFRNEWEKAKVELDKYKGQQDAMYNRLVDIIGNRSYSPATLLCFKSTQFGLV